ncbi:MAG TPA: hypothetical protein VKG80_06860 [Trebonia sp.]|nr:hypothetical protein [Trebonia sp.]
MAGAWVVSASQTVTTPAHVATQACLRELSGGAGFDTKGGGALPEDCIASLARLHLRQVETYQPASRYWAFQWYETAIFLALALALAGFCFWRLRRIT